MNNEFYTATRAFNFDITIWVTNLGGLTQTEGEL